MNNSRRTTIICNGICLWARVIDQPVLAQTDDERDNVENWEKWAETWPMFVEFVKAEQFALFDRVNAKVW